MACYAAVLSLYHNLNNINIHPRPPISLDQQQLQSLTQNLTFLQHFLESYPTYEDDDLERCIANAVYAAEDQIEIQIVNQIHAGSHISTLDLSQALERVIQYMDSIRKEVMQIKKHKDIAALHHYHLPTNSVASGGPAASTWQSITPVFDNAMIIEVLDKLTGQQSGLHFISIVGMGGIGKTTFATSIYSRSLVVEHFDIRAWVTISQEYSTRNILVPHALRYYNEEELPDFCLHNLCRLQKLEECYDLKYWETDSSHFPCLEHLRLYRSTELEEIPSSIGDIPTLKSIRYERCSRSGVHSAKRIKEEQEENGNEDLHVVIERW